MGRPPNKKESVWSKLVILDNGCWQWTGGLSTNGYGKMNVNGQGYMIHRLAYEIAVGPIPAGLHLDHLCRNRGCINPLHLEPVTPKENLMRGFGACANNSRKTHCKWGHAFDENNTASDRGKRRCAECRRRRDEEGRRRRGVLPRRSHLYCKNNHPMFGPMADMYFDGNGVRRCRVCRRISRRNKE